ncbi:integrase domain-containing protein [Catenovulum agarivorans]|uniref:integrase domain-containing protein n=1 Tax=Catenovulum agarivorans TaxID=1172192 RepID=UPI0002E4A913|nr:integrase domain-containing protein [Catenovulum agarivorans]
MARLTVPLTNTQISKAKPKDKEYLLADGDGLNLRVKPSGSKTWIFRYYQPITKKRNNISFGQYPSVSLAQARDKRREAKELLAQDIDPKVYKDHLQEQQKQAIESTFGKMAEKWFELKKTQVKEETAAKAWQLLNKHVLQHLQNVPIEDLRPKMIVEILHPIAQKGNYETLKRTCRTINEIMRLGVAAGYIEFNYLADVTRLFPSPKAQNMPTIRPERLPELMQAIANARINLQTRCLIEWQLHTMTRPIEAATAKWCDIDFQNNTWVIPAERMKMKKPHTIPLTKQVIKLLEVIKSLNSHREYLFPGHRNPKSHANSQTVNVALKRMGFAGELVSHGLRALASTTLNEQGFDPDLIESALAHADRNEVRRAYNRAEYIERRRELMNWWSERIEIASNSNVSLCNFSRKQLFAGG